MTSFNVLYEPWIPMTNGETRSLMSALEDAGSLEGVQCESATETFAVYRLMIAFVMDAFALPLRDERSKTPQSCRRRARNERISHRRHAWVL